MRLPGLDQPVMLHSSRMAMCKLPPKLCAWKSQKWRNWYTADYDYAHATVYFLVVLIACFALAHLVHLLYLSPRMRSWRNARSNRLVDRPLAVVRYFSYRQFAIPQLGWYSPALGLILLGCAAWVYFAGLTLGPKPYYWPRDGYSYGSSPPIATRAGWMAVALMPFTVASAAKWNWFTVVTGISHERLQLFHRWSSWLMFVLALIHTFPFIVYHIQVKHDMVENWNTQVVYWTGVAALIPQAWLNFMSIGPIRNRFYETFRAFHYIAAALFLVFFFIHCDFRLTSWDYFIAMVIIYGLSLVGSAVQTYLLNGFSHRATFELQADGIVQIRIPTHITWKPGQHVFVRFMSTALGLPHVLTMHPFSICSIPRAGRDSVGVNEVILYVRPKGGITKRIHDFAKASPGVSLPVLLDGPYGSAIDSAAFTGYDRFFVVAGGSGGGTIFPILETLARRVPQERALAKGAEEGVADPVLSLQVVWVVRKLESIAWFQERVSRILSQPFPGFLQISIYVTHPDHASSAEGEAGDPDKSANVSGSAPGNDIISVYPTGKRPDLPAMIQAATQEDTRPLAITGKHAPWASFPLIVC
ncbi:hypothetical protein VTN02DRAFT_5407 [Thermoascus thermophilus]